MQPPPSSCTPGRPMAEPNLVEGVEKKGNEHVYDGEADHIDRETARWWLNAIADEIEGRDPIGTTAGVVRWLRGEGDG